MSIMSKSEAVRRAIEAVCRDVIRKETKNCLRVYEGIVTATDTPNGKADVRLVGQDESLTMPYVSGLSPSVGDAVMVAVPYGSWRSAFVWRSAKVGN